MNLHSQIIYNLLVPKNKLHKKFANLFFKLLMLGELKEKEYIVDKEYRNIDILVRTADRAIIIENKINVGDQPFQFIIIIKKC